MAIVNQFYNGTSRRYVALFGSLFNKMSITREDNAGAEIQRMVVPIAYGPFQKFLSKIIQDPKFDKKSAITLPRMSFEINSMSYDGMRKTNSLNKIITNTPSGFVYSPAPYNIEFSLYIMTKYSEDGTKIMEQILPFFKPEYTFTAKILDDAPAFDIPLILNSVSSEDMYEADYESRRALMWTLSFTMKGWFFGPSRERKVIKFVDVRTHGDTDLNTPENGQITTQPGLTATGDPTTDLSNSVSYDTIELDDDWGVITIIKEFEDE